MNLYKLASIYFIKYAIDPEVFQSSLRKKIDLLYSYPHKLFNILEAAANAGLSNAKTPEELKAYAGFKFVKEVVELIDYLKENKDMSLGSMRDVLLKIANLIAQNKNVKFTENGRLTQKEENQEDLTGKSYVQFPHVSALVHALYPIRGKHDIKLRDELQSKARTGLTRIFGLSSQMLEDLQELEAMTPEAFTFDSEQDINQDLPKRFYPQRGQISPSEVIKFIREHGDEYGIKNTDEWLKVVENDPALKERMTTLVNSLLRGNHPSAQDLRSEISGILEHYRNKNNLSNAQLFEETESS